MARTIACIALAVFLLLFGLFAVTNVDITWGKPIMGFAAIVAGICWGVVGFRGGG